MKRVLLGAASALAIMTGSAFAADVIAPEPIADWTGFYLGVHGGWAWADVDAKYKEDSFNEDCFENDPIFPGGCPVNLNLDGAFVGGQAGFNFQLDNGLVLGVEGDYDFMNLEDDDVAGDPDFFIFIFPVDFSTRVKQEIDQVASIRGRLGFAMGSFLPFVTGGWAWAQGERSAEGTFVDESEKNWHDGWTVGGGFEYLISDHWSVKAEYRYYDFGKEDYFKDSITGGTEVDIDMQTVQVGINFHL
jgi:outer membrane immunogenic protein